MMREEVKDVRGNVGEEIEESIGLGARCFFVTSLVFLLLATGMLAGRPDFLLRPTLTGHGLAWMILLLLGAGMGGVFGVVYWALPRVFRVPLYSEKFALLHYGFHYVGVLLVLASIVWKGFGRGEMGMTFLACGALVMGINLIGTFRKPALPDVASAYLVSSALWLLIVGLLGVPFSERAPIEVLEGTQWSAGWLLLTVTGVLLNLGMGVALRLTPAVLRVKARNTSVAWYGFAFSNAGLAWMFPAATFGQKSFLLVCLGVYGVGVLLFLGRYFMDVQLREEEGLGWDSRIVFTSVWLIPVAVGVLGWAVWSRMWQEKPAEVATAGGVGVVEEVAKGGLPLEYFSADGAVFLISVLAVAVPMAVGLGFGLLRLEGREAGGEFGGGIHAKLTEQVLLAAYFNYAAGVLLVVPGAWFSIGQMLSLGSLFLVVGGIGFLGCYLLASGKLKGWLPERIEEVGNFEKVVEGAKQVG